MIQGDEEMVARLELEAHCKSMGRVIADAIPRGTGFVFVMFDFGEKGNMAYVGNGERSDVVRMLGELRDKIRAQ